MWFHLLFVAAFIGLGSCGGHGFTKFARSGVTSCSGTACSCVCESGYCPPCPLPFPAVCLFFCGSSDCPCGNNPLPRPRSSSRSDTRNNGNADLDILTAKADSISTINVYPTGPICSGFNILPTLVVTVSSCIAGKNLGDLFVTVNNLNSDILVAQPLKVLQIKTYPYSNTHVYPVVLILEEPKITVNYLALPALPIEESHVVEIHKWYTQNQGQDYFPLKEKAKSHSKCKNATEELLCVTNTVEFEMGWNDIGTPLVEMRHLQPMVQGIYIGHDLYQKSLTHRYLPLYQYAPWLYSVVEEYNLG